MLASEITLIANGWFVLAAIVVGVAAILSIVLVIKTGVSIKSSLIQIESKGTENKKTLEALGTPNGKGNLTKMSETILYRLDDMDRRFVDLGFQIESARQVSSMHTGAINKLSEDMSNLTVTACEHYKVMNDHLAAHQIISDKLEAGGTPKTV